MTSHSTSDAVPPRDSDSFFHVPWYPSEMCTADDVFFGGKVLPCRAPSPPPRTRGNIHMPKSHVRRRRRSTAAEYRRLGKVSEVEPGISSPEAAHPAPRPRWYVLAFGSVRVPAEMEMRDIRSRQRRRNSVTALPPASGGLRGPWKLIRSLSCKGVETVAVVTAPLNFN